MFQNPYNEDIKAKMMNINRAAIRNDKKVSTKGLLNVSSTGVIGGAHPADVGRPIGGGKVADFFQGLLDKINPAMRIVNAIKERNTAITKENVARARRIGGARKASPWIEHVKKFAADHKISYRDALRNPKCKESYKKMSGSGNVFGKKKSASISDVLGQDIPTDRRRIGQVLHTPRTVVPGANEAFVQEGANKYNIPNEGAYAVLGAVNQPPPVPSRAKKPKGGALSGGYRTKGASDKKPRKTSAWVTFVKEYAAKHNISYPCAMSQCKEEYKASKEAAKAAKPKKRLIKKKALVVEAPPVVEAPKPKKRLIRKKTIGDVPSYVTA